MSGLTTLRTLYQRCQSSLGTSIPKSSSKMNEFYQDHCIYLPAMIGWFIFSIFLTLYNKYLFGKQHLAFPCPLLLTSFHFLTQWLFSYLISSKFPISLGGDQVSAMPWMVFLGIGVPCGLVTSADVGFSNLAIVRISVAFNTMVKASSPIFVVLSAYLFGIEKITTSLILVVIIICMGELLTVLGEVKFDLIGFLLSFSSAILSGMRWTVVQLKIQSIEPKLKSTVATMRILSLPMFLSMLGISLALEKPWSTLGGWFDSFSSAMHTLGLALIGALLAVCMILFEFWLIMKSNAIVLMIGGVCKELFTISMSILIFGDTINIENVLGCIVVFSGVILYKLSLHVNKLQDSYDKLLLQGKEFLEEDLEDLTDDGIILIQHGEESHPVATASNGAYDSLNTVEGRDDLQQNNEQHGVFVIDDEDDDQNDMMDTNSNARNSLDREII